MLLPNLLACASAALLLAMVPGPSTAVVLRQTLRSGRRAAIAATLANELGALFWVLAAAVGLSALVAASQLAYDALRLVGALVLMALGAQSLWRARRGAPTPKVPAEIASDPGDPSGPGEPAAHVALPRPMSHRGHSHARPAANMPSTRSETWRAFRVGLVTTIANPKAVVFAASFLPQFVPPHAPVFATLLLLALVWVLVDASWYVGLVWVVSRAHGWFAHSGLRRRLEQVTGLVLIGVGVRLAIERH
jgi:threonine/homoserine/homoserine lactone efflux protein